ncbi:MAG: Uma2 family endonuclease [Dehalococcoidia bacterium]
MQTVLVSLPMVVPADHVPGPLQGCWTYDDYAAIPEDGKRYEVVDGVLYIMPGPNTGHQTAAVNFTTFLTIHVRFSGKGRVFAAPYDVELGPGDVVQPDVVVVLSANLGIITASRIIGAPDLVVEIASPGTATHDRRKKQDAYARAGVPEYWIADPYAHTIELLCLEGDAYRSIGVFAGQSTLPSLVIPDLPVRVEQFFA